MSIGMNAYKKPLVGEAKKRFDDNFNNIKWNESREKTESKEEVGEKA